MLVVWDGDQTRFFLSPAKLYVGDGAKVLNIFCWLNRLVFLNRAYVPSWLKGEKGFVVVVVLESVM